MNLAICFHSNSLYAGRTSNCIVNIIVAIFFCFLIFHFLKLTKITLSLQPGVLKYVYVVEWLNQAN
jgi:hypothetical protein